MEMRKNPADRSGATETRSDGRRSQDSSLAKVWSGSKSAHIIIPSIGDTRPTSVSGRGVHARSGDGDEGIGTAREGSTGCHESYEAFNHHGSRLTRIGPGEKSHLSRAVGGLHGSVRPRREDVGEYRCVYMTPSTYKYS